MIPIAIPIAPNSSGCLAILLVILELIYPVPNEPNTEDTTEKTRRAAMPHPQISVIMPAYNPGDYLQEAVESILNQAPHLLARPELIIIDDGSTDATAAAVATLFRQIACGQRPNATPTNRPPVELVGLRYRFQPNRGPAAARNLGIDLARGQFLSFLDADDRWSPGVLQRHFDYLQRHAETLVVQGMTRLFRTLPTDTVPTDTVPADTVPADTAPTEEAGEIKWTPKMDSGLYRREAFAIVGLLDESLWFSEDLDWYLRARAREISMTLLPDVAIDYRRHAHNMTNDLAVHKGYEFRVWQQAMQRRRQK